MTLIFFLGGGWRGEMVNCAYLRKNPGYAPVIRLILTKWDIFSLPHTTEFPRLSRLGSNHYSIPYNLSVNLTDFCHNQYINHANDHTYHWVLSYSITTLNWHLKLSIMFYLVFHSCPFPESFIERHSRPRNVPFIGFKLPFTNNLWHPTVP